jgi:hypothetical protein
MIFSLFYNQTQVVEYFNNSGLANPFSCLKQPPKTFLEDESDDEEEEGAAVASNVSTDQWFLIPEIEIFAMEIAAS